MLTYFFAYRNNNPDAFERFFLNWYKLAMSQMKLGRELLSIIILKQGAWLFRKACKKGKYIYCVTTDNCSRFLITQYSKKGLGKRKRKLLNNNYIFFNGDYYSLNLNDGVVVRLIRNEEFECDYGFELIFNEELVNKLTKITKGI